MNIAICPGSFDPVTVGHMDIIQRASQRFDRLIVAVTDNSAKKSAFSVEERIEMLRESAAYMALDNVEVCRCVGLLADFAKAMGAASIVKGLRAVSDFEYERQMAEVNQMLNPGLDTVFFMSSGAHTFISSTVVREVGRYGGDITSLVCPPIRQKIEDRLYPHQD